MWQRVERLMRGTIQNLVDRETHFNNEFDQFVAKPGEALVFIYNRFAQLMNDLERNHIKFPPVSLLTQRDTVQNNYDDPLTSAMILLARAIAQNFSTLTNNRRRTSSNTRNQQLFKETNEKGHYARNCPKPRIRDSKYFMEQMLLAKLDEAGVILTDEENDFLFVDALRMEEIKKKVQTFA
nr:hypothetical protein [Tanacetum cinerariifolium]